MVLYQDVRIFFLDAACEFCQECRSSDAGHVFQADFIAAVFHDFVHDAHVIFHRVDRGVGDGKCHL